ncbi:MAG TPA: HlyD family type I secretion periplasmic adaptor subunit [Oculatellaceae cyanobacterium]
MPVVDKHEFKPILAEIEDSPVSPMGRAIFWLVIATFAIAVAWSVFGEVDIVVSAPGKVIPDGQVKIVQPLETGVIQKILVKEGDHVKKNQVLMEIDPSSTSPEVETSSKNLGYAKLEQDRLNAMVTETSFLPKTEADQAAVATQTALYAASKNDLQKQLRMKDEELKKVEQQMASNQSEKAQNVELLRVASEKEQRLKEVLDLIPRDDYEKVTNDILGYKSRITQAECKLSELEHQKLQTNEEIAHIKEEFKSNNLKELADKQRQTSELEAKVKVSSFQNAQKLVLSPVDGHVDTMFVHTVGGVVTPAEKLVSIVPDNVPLVVQAYVANRDIGFVRKGASAAIKVDTFDFQKYGMLNGRVSLVSHDSREDEKLGQIFDVYIRPSESYIKVDNRREQLASGMTVISEVKTGRRRIIEFFLYPIVKYLHEGFSVR